jgi:katanin p80 WD40 repeat-containing subunit B1
MARLHRVSEFVAHTGVVNCVHLGPKKGGVLATGGDDRKINIWRVSSSPTQVMSLGGLTTPVTAVRFDWLEECVVGATEGGSLLLYDLQHGGKAARRLNSHKTACTTVDFHPYGEFLASGSSDCQVKVWDIRRKQCITTFKGHGAPLRKVCFSPDGRWVVSGDGDGVIKLWDLTAGKVRMRAREEGGGEGGGWGVGGECVCVTPRMYGASVLAGVG